MPYYAVANGRNKGVYNSWSECENQVKGFSSASYKKFDTIAGAQDFVAGSVGGGGGSSRNTPSNYCSDFTQSPTSNYDHNRSYSASNSYQSKYNHSFNAQHGPSKSDHYDQYCRVNADTSELKQMHDTSCGSGEFEMDDNGYVQVYTDGACSSNGRSGAKAGLGVYWGENHPLNKSEPVSGRATNNSGEIQAATAAINQALKRGVTKLAVNTDSQFLIDSATKWMPGWKQNGWKLASGEPVKNERDFKQLDNAVDKLNIKWNYVEAHQGIQGNEMADQLAKAGASKYKQ